MFTKLIPVFLFVLLQSCIMHNEKNSSNNKNTAKKTESFLWLENLKSEESLNWVRKENLKTLKRLTQNTRFKVSEENIVNQYTNQKAVEKIHFLGGQLIRVKKHSESSNGILETMSVEESRKENPAWQVLIDFDLLSQQLGQSVTYGIDSVCNPNNPSQCMIALSSNGSDNAVMKEFDLKTKQFVANGFTIPSGTTYISWIDNDNLLFSSTFGDNPVSKSGYGLSVKWWQRGTQIKNAITVMEKSTGDGLIPIQYYSNGRLYIIIQHWHDYYNGSNFYYQPKQKKLTHLDIPTSHEIYGVNNGILVVKNYKNWSINGIDYQKGSLIGVSLGGQNSKLERIFSPAKHQAFKKVHFTKSKILIMLLEDMISKPVTFEKRDNTWVKEYITPPSNDVLRILSTSYLNDEAIVFYLGFLNPTTLYFVDTVKGKHRFWKKATDFFETSNLKYEIAYAKGEDGVKIPYQIVGPKNLDPKKRYPVIIYVYGSYGVARTAWYSPSIGAEWLSKGGVYVIANARGGGAYGEEWHQAAIRTTKYKTADDVATVAKALIERKISLPTMIGVYGSSSGGTTACSILVRYPELVNAAVCESGFTDMLKYNELFKGSSWIPEYGDPNIPNEREYLLKYSTYHLVEKNKNYPAPFFISYLNDDRVHPSHYRRMAAKMEKLGMDYYFYESPEGGHAGAVTKKERSRVRAMEYEYFKQRLFNPSNTKH